MLNYGLDSVFHALADPGRRLMVERLARGPASVSELSRPLVMTLPAVLQHLQVLEASGLVRSEKLGRIRTCRIESGALRTAEQWINERRTKQGAFLDEFDNPKLREQGTRDLLDALDAALRHEPAST